MNVVLPAEIQVQESPQGVRYTLPQRPIAVGLWRVILIEAALGALALLGGLVLFATMPGDPTKASPHVGVGTLCSVFGLILLGHGLALLATHTTIELTGDELRLTEWIFIIPRRRVRRRAQLHSLVTHYLVGTGEPDPPTNGVIEVVGNGCQSLWFAHAYPQTWLAPLARALAERCGIPTAERPMHDTEVVKIAPFFCDMVRDEDTFDEELQPAQSNAVLEQLADGVTVTLPPLGLWRERTLGGWLMFALLPWAVAAIFVWSILVRGGAEAAMLLVPLGLAALGSVPLLWVRHCLRRWTALVVEHGQLLLIERGPIFPGKEHVWLQTHISAIRVGPAPSAPRGSDWLALWIYTVDGRCQGLLGQRDNAELRWLATVLRRALRKPAMPRKLAQVR